MGFHPEVTSHRHKDDTTLFVVIGWRRGATPHTKTQNVLLMIGNKYSFLETHYSWQTLGVSQQIWWGFFFQWLTGTDVGSLTGKVGVRFKAKGHACVTGDSCKQAHKHGKHACAASRCFFGLHHLSPPVTAGVSPFMPHNQITNNTLPVTPLALQGNPASSRGDRHSSEGYYSCCSDLDTWRITECTKLALDTSIAEINRS